MLPSMGIPSAANGLKPLQLSLASTLPILGTISKAIAVNDLTAPSVTDLLKPASSTVAPARSLPSRRGTRYPFGPQTICFRSEETGLKQTICPRIGLTEN